MAHDTTFERVSQTDAPMYGPRKLLLCGFSASAQQKLRTVLEMAGLADVPTVWLNRDHAATRVSELAQLPDKTGWEISSDLPRGIIVSGIREKDLHRLMTLCRKTGMKNALWAALTPTSETWTLEQLLNELSAERKAMGKGKKKGKRR